MARARGSPKKRHLRRIEGGIEDDDEEREVQIKSRELLAIRVASHLAMRVDKKGKIVEVFKAIGMVAPERMIGMNISSFIADTAGTVSAMENLKHTMKTGQHSRVKLHCRRLLSDFNTIALDFTITRDTAASAIIYSETQIYDN